MQHIFIITFIVVCLLNSIVGQDPASSWLAYTKSPGNGGTITYINATWIVPAEPKIKNGVQPGFWFGIEPEPACNLIQPILAYQEGWQIFNGYYQWDNGYWYESANGNVQAGNTIFGSVTYVQASHSYDMYIECKESGWNVKSNIKIEGEKIYTDSYFVIERQPPNCEQYPQNGGITFYDINIEINGTAVAPQWIAKKFEDACDCTPIVNNATSVTFTWNFLF